jgi:hypothetical protein
MANSAIQIALTFSPGQLDKVIDKIKVIKIDILEEESVFECTKVNASKYYADVMFRIKTTLFTSLHRRALIQVLNSPSPLENKIYYP